MSLTIDLIVAPRLLVPPALIKHLRMIAPRLFNHLPKNLRFPAEATLLLTGNAAQRRLNRDFRGIDKPTNVLSFPQFSPDEILKKRPKSAPVALGDIAMAFPYVLDEARKTGKKPGDHVTHLMIHGVLHLFGYDHIHDTDAVRMERLETKIMAALGFPDPYQATHIMEPKQGRTSGTQRRPKTSPPR